MLILYSVQTRTHPGKVRGNNEDAFGTVLDWRQKLGLTDEVLQQRGHLFAVADGMGGHAAGEVASQMAIETLFTEYYTGDWTDVKTSLATAIDAANRAILEKAGANVKMGGMGTTLVAALYTPDSWLVANVGDSRGYLFRAGKIRQVTRDHSWVAEQVSSGIISAEDAVHHPLRNVITRSLGNEASVQPDFFDLDARPGDIMLLCSDGLSNLVSEGEIRQILKPYTLDEAADRLLELALERGAPDNVTLALIQSSGGEQRRSRSFLPWLALVVAVMIIGWFVYRSFERNAPEPAPTIITNAVVVSTFTPAFTPESPHPTPTPVPEPVAAPRPFGKVGANNAVVIAAPDAADGRTLVFVSGDATVEPIPEDEGWEQLIINTGDGGMFSATLDKLNYVGSHAPVAGGRLALAGHALENSSGPIGQSLDPLLLLAPFVGGDLFAVVWEKDDQAIQTFLDRFDLQGEVTPFSDSLIIIQLQP